MAIIPMKGGLDLRSAVTSTNPGTLYQCENFEVALTDGYRRIDGYTRFDGREAPNSLSVYTFRAQFADGERGGNWGGLDGGIPFYEGFGVNSGIWPPADFDAFQVGDRISYRAFNGYDSSTVAGGYVNHMYYNPAVRGVIIEAPDFVNVTGTDIDDVDLTVRTGQVFIPGNTGALFRDRTNIIPLQEKRFYGRSVIHKGDGQGQSSFQGATSFAYGTFFTDMFITGPWGTFGAYNVDLQPIEGLDWSAYNGAASGNLSIHRQEVNEFPSGNPIGMHWVDNTLYAVAETQKFNVSNVDTSVEDLIEPRQWCYYKPSYQLTTDGIVGVTNNRSIIEAHGGEVYQSSHLVNFTDTVELLMPELDPASSDDTQEPDGLDLYLLTQIEFKDFEGTAPGFGGSIPIGGTLSTAGGYAATIRAAEIRPDGTSGFCLVETSAGSLSEGDDVTTSDFSGFVVVSVYGGSELGNALCTIDSPLVEPKQAIVVKSTDTTGFEPLDMGYEIRFDTGTNEPLTIYEKPNVTPVEDDTGFLSPTAARSKGVVGANWVANTGTLASSIAANDSNYARFSLSNSGGRSSYLVAQGLGITIGDLDAVRGIEVEVIAEQGSGTGDLFIDSVGYYVPDDDVVRSVVVNQPVSTKATFTLGGPTDTFDSGGSGSGAFDNELFKDPDFGIAVKFAIRNATVTPIEARVYHIQVKVHFTEGSSQVFFYDGSKDVGSANVIHKRVESGSWLSNDVVGILSMRGEIGGAIEPGTQIRTLSGGFGTLIAEVVDGPNLCRLPGLSAIDSESSKYQFLTSNFFASKDLEATYGVNGAGPAFVFNEDYFFFLRTGVNDDFAKPRHVSRLADRLVLAYNNGNMDLSAPGRPADYGSGATTLGVGDKITGMLVLQGDALAVFTEGKIIAFQGADNDTFQQRVISPSSGAIEYTVADMGMPVFCDFRGISTISTTEKYGDFERGRMSWAVQSWLSPRVQSSRKGIDADISVAGILVVRNKNQYRVIFKDGKVLTMTVTQEAPEFTIQTYRVNRPDRFADSDGLVLESVPDEWVYEEEAIDLLATCWGVTPEGQDRIFMSARNYPYVLEVDKGVTFDGEAINSHVTLNLGSLGDPRQNKRANNLHVFGQILGVATLGQQVGVNYNLPSGPTTEFVLGGANKDYYEEERPAFAKTRVNAVGRDIFLKISHSSPTEQPFTLQSYSWPDASPRRLER